MKSFLFIGAHPDDIDIGCLGTILSLKKKHNVNFLILSDGEAGGNRESRLSEVKKINTQLKNCTLYFGHLKDASISHCRRTISIIENIMQETNPDYIFTHTFKDSHQDHIGASLSSISATRQKLNLIFYQTPSTLQTFSPNLFIDISVNITQKIELLKIYHSQIIKSSINIDAIKANNEYYGFLNNTKYCEPFEIFKLKYKNLFNL